MNNFIILVLSILLMSCVTQQPKVQKQTSNKQLDRVIASESISPFDSFKLASESTKKTPKVISSKVTIDFNKCVVDSQNQPGQVHCKMKLDKSNLFVLHGLNFYQDDDNGYCNIGISLESIWASYNLHGDTNSIKSSKSESKAKLLKCVEMSEKFIKVGRSGNTYKTVDHLDFLSW